MNNTLEKTYTVIETIEALEVALQELHKYLDKTEENGQKPRLALDTETYTCKESRDRYDLEYSLTRLRRGDKVWAKQIQGLLDSCMSMNEIKASDIWQEMPEAFELRQNPDPEERYPIPEPILNKWGFHDARVRLIQIGINPAHINLQYIFDLDKIRLDNCYGSEKNYNQDHVFPFYAEIGRMFKPLLDRVTIVGQNLKYEYKFFWAYFKIRLKLMRDTYLINQVIYTGDKISHSLGNLYRQHIPKAKFSALIGYVPEIVEDEEGNQTEIDDPSGWYDKFKKEEQLSPWYAENLSPKQYVYGSHDVFLIWPVFERQLEIASDWANKHDTGVPGTGILEIIKLECELIKAISKAEVVGFPLDLDYYENELRPALEKEIQEAQEEADKLFKKTVTREKKVTTVKGKKDKKIEFVTEVTEESYNLNSPDQIRVILGPELCALLPKTDKGKPSTAADELFIIQDKHPIIPLALRVKRALKTISSFEGERGYKNNMDSNGVIHHTIHQLGREESGISTGRMAGAKPNLMQVDNDPKVRRAFVPESKEDKREGKKKKIIIWDYSQIEPRLQGEDALDDFLIGCFRDGRDLHAETAKNIFHLDFLPDKHKPEDKPWRDRGKEIRLARTYLMGIDKGIKKVYVESKGKLDYILRGDEGRQAFIEDLNTFDNLTPQLKELKENMENEVKALAIQKKGLAFAADGRPFYVAKSMMGRTRRFCLSPEDRRDAMKNPEDWDFHKKVYYTRTGNTSSWSNKCNSELRDAAREAGNNRFQMSAADIFKSAIVKANLKLEEFEEEWANMGYTAYMVNFVHDEIIAIASEEVAEIVSKIIHDSMVEAAKPFFKVVPVLVEGGIAPNDSWADK